MKINLPDRLFRRLAGLILYHADTEFLASSIKFRSPNSAVFWIRKNVIELLESGLGKKYFESDYAETKDILSESDYLGLILKTDLHDKLFHFYIRVIYRNNEFPEFTKSVETYIKNNSGECIKLFFRILNNYLQKVPHELYRFLVDMIDFDRMQLYKKDIAVIASFCKGKRTGAAIGLERPYQMNFFKPIVDKFVHRGMPFIYICEEESQRKNTSLVQKDGYFLFRVRLPTSREVFNKREYKEAFRNDILILKDRISSSSIHGSYKKFISDKLDKYVNRYYKIRFFLDEFMKNVDIAFAFALPDRFVFQRTLLMLCKRRGIPTFTYEAYFNTSEAVTVWYYFSDRVLLANKKHVDMVVEKGFSKDRICHIGSTLADYYVTDRKADNCHEDGVNVLLLTKPAHRTGLKNYAIIDEIFRVFDRSGLKYAIYIKPHPADNDSYSKYTRLYSDNLFMLGRTEPLYKYVPRMDLLITCGVTGAILECLPAKKPIIGIDLTSTTDKKIFSRGDLGAIVPFFYNLKDFNFYFTNFVNDVLSKDRRSIEIPQSLIDDFYYKLDGNTAHRVCEYVISKISKKVSCQ